MNGKEHIFFGLASSVTVVSIITKYGGTVPVTNLGVVMASAALGSLLPDIDTPDSTLGRLIKPVSYAINNKFGHRTITHDILAAIIAFIVSFFVGNQIFFGIMLGILSHLFLDGLTRSGVTFNYLYNAQFFMDGCSSSGKGIVHLLPKFLRCYSGGFVSWIYTMLDCAACLLPFYRLDLWSLYPNFA